MLITRLLGVKVSTAGIAADEVTIIVHMVVEPISRCEGVFTNVTLEHVSATAEEDKICTRGCTVQQLQQLQRKTFVLVLVVESFAVL